MASQHRTTLRDYPISQSPFYRLRSRKKLASLYNKNLREIESLIARDDNYRIFMLKSTNRRIEWPKPALEQLHYRTLSLLQKIKAPEYLHSGIPNRSYITNASCHKGHFSTIKLDISKFYPSTNGTHIFGGLRKQFSCSEDVAGLITKMCTYDGHLPTGSCVSQILGFYAHKQMFDEIWSYCKEKNFVMTCYVDDITITGDKVGLNTIRAVGHIIRQRGLNFHKEHYFPAGKPKIITGVVVHGPEIRVPNRRQLIIHDSLLEMRANIPSQQLYKKMDRLLGRLNSAAEVEQRYRALTTEAKALMLKNRAKSGIF